MLLLSILFCFSVLLQSSSPTPLAAVKPKPVDLSHSCMSVTPEGGRNDSVPIILLHGLGLAKESWMGIYQVLALRTGKRVCIADLRNHGDSPWSSETDIEAMATDINRLLEIMKVPKAIVLGHSLGGKVAIHFTLKNPTKVEKLIVEDMRPNGMTQKALAEIKFFLALLQQATKAIPEGASEKQAKEAVLKYMNDLLTKTNSSEALDSRAGEFLPLKCINGKCQWKTNTQIMGKVMQNPLAFLTESKGRFDGPTLFVYGTVSPFKIYEDKSSIQTLFPKAKLVGVEGASHVVHGRPEFLDAVIKFINAN